MMDLVDSQNLACMHVKRATTLSWFSYICTAFSVIITLSLLLLVLLIRIHKDVFTYEICIQRF